MANYLDVRRGDRLPVVAGVQALLNAAGAELTVDGDFGGRTARAVERFQKDRGLTADGIVGRRTWGRLDPHGRHQILDFVDIVDADLDTSEVSILRGIGADPVVPRYLKEASPIDNAVRQLAGRMRSTFLLRFHGHGEAGKAGVASGECETVPDPEGYDAQAGGLPRGDFGNDWESLLAWRRLAGRFGPFGSVQFMHCQTGRGSKGQTFAANAAEAMGVPATAGIDDGYATTAREVMRYEGPVRTRCPGNVLSIREWAKGQRLPAASAYTPA